LSQTPSGGVPPFSAWPAYSVLPAHFLRLLPTSFSFCIARFITGIGVGAIIPVADSHLLEWSPAPWRARLALVGAAFAVGTLIACGVGIAVHELFGADSEWWRVMLIICIIPGFMSLPAIFFLLPESMHWLLVRGRHDEVKELLKQLNSLNSTELLSDGNVIQFTIYASRAGGGRRCRPAADELAFFGSLRLGVVGHHGISDCCLYCLWLYLLRTYFHLSTTARNDFRPQTQRGLHSCDGQ